MKTRVISTISALCFLSAIGYFGYGVYKENKVGEEETKTRFDTLLLATKNSAETSKITSAEFKSDFFNAVGDFSDFSEISLSVDGTCIYSYPPLEDKLSGTAQKNKKFISKKRSTTTAKNIVSSPVDEQDLSYDLTLETGIYKIKQNTIYNNAKIAFFIALAGTILSVIAIIMKNSEVKATSKNDARLRREEELLKQIREERQRILEAQREQEYDGGIEDDEFDDDEFDDQETIEETGAYTAEGAEEEPAAQEQSFEDTIVFTDEMEQGAENGAEPRAVEEQEQDAVGDTEKVESETETESETVESESSTDAGTETTSETENASETESETAESESRTEAEAETTSEAHDTDGETEESVISENANEGENETKSVFQEPVLEDTSTKDGDLGTIGTDIASPKTFIQDLGEQLRKNTYTEISLALIKITDFDWDAYETEEKAKEIIALAKENFEESSEIYKADIPNTLGIVLNGTDLTETIAECEKILPAIQEVLGSLEGEHKVHIGISAMNYRAIPPDRIMVEAKGALEEAESDPDNPIVAFKANPDLYKKEIGNELEQE